MKNGKFLQSCGVVLTTAIFSVLLAACGGGNGTSLAPAVPCVGSWQQTDQCSTNGKIIERYVVTIPAAFGGTQCEATDGATRDIATSDCNSISLGPNVPDDSASADTTLRLETGKNLSNNKHKDSNSVVQSSNGNSGITTDDIAYSITPNSDGSDYDFTIRKTSGTGGGTNWTVDQDDVTGGSSNSGSDYYELELEKDLPGGMLYVDVYSDIDDPEEMIEETTSPGDRTPVNVPDDTSILGSGVNLSAGGSISWPGSYNGQNGTFTCGSSCRIAGGVNVSGRWTFRPDASSVPDITTRTTSYIADTDYLAGAVWLYVPDGATSASQLEMGSYATGGDPFDDITTANGSATYQGETTGSYIYTYLSNSGNGVDDAQGTGYFTGSVVLNADFDADNISGSLTDIILGGDGDPTRYEGVTIPLGTASITQTGNGFFTGSVSYTEAPDTEAGRTMGGTYTGNWGGSFYGNAEAQPGSVSGTYGISNFDNPGTWVYDGETYRERASVVGIFGAHKR